MSNCHGCGKKNCHNYPKCSKECLCEVDIPSFKCIRTDEDFSCIGIKKGDTLSQAISAINQKFCNFIEGQTGPAGVGISTVVYNPDTGQITFTYTNGFIYVTESIGSSDVEVNIENTLIVSKNGNDSTGLRNDWTKPFITVVAASTAAQSGDLIIVYPGTYNEDNFIVSDVNYEFKLGVTMISSTNCINDSSGPKNINITGEGNFVSTSARGIFLANAASTISMTLRDLFGFSDGIAIGNADTVDIKGRNINVGYQYLATIRGNSKGRIHFDVWDGSSAVTASASIYFVNHSLDLQTREFEISGKILYSNSVNIGGFVIDNSPTLKVKANIDIEHNSTVSNNNIAAIAVKSGSLQYTGKAFSSNNIGISVTNVLTQPVTVWINDSEIVGQGHSLRTLSDGSVYVRCDRTVFRKLTTTGTPSLQIDSVDDNIQIILRNSDIYNLGTVTGADGIFTADNLSVVRLSDVRVVLKAAGGFLMDSAVVRDVLIESIVSSNKDLSVDVTNSITGSVLVVDAAIEDNDFNF